MRIAAVILRFFRVAALLATLPVASSADLVRYSLCDVRVLYLFDDPSSIDWPTLYYLNDEFGCRIDLLTLKARSKPGKDAFEVDKKEIFLHTYYCPHGDLSVVDSLLADIFRERRSDIVIFGDEGSDEFCNAFRSRILELAPAAGSLFDILKVFQRLEAKRENTAGAGSVVLNGRELFERYRDRMDLEISGIFPGFKSGNYRGDRLTRYQLVKGNLDRRTYDESFLSGISPLRLEAFIDRLFRDGPMKRTFVKQARKFVSYFRASRLSTGRTKADFIVDGYRELRNLTLHERAISELPVYRSYLESLRIKAEGAALDAVGIGWDGEIILRDSPHGPRLKFRVSISADGPKEVAVNSLKFHPYWDTTVVELDAKPRVITPHQSYTREFLVDIERAYLEGEILDSLMFTMEIAYGQIPLVFTSKMPVWEAPDIQVRFEPDYYFVPPFAKLDIDRVVSSMNWKVVITKPKDCSGTARINLETPRGLFAGAYRTKVRLDKGVTTETVRIPFTISGLFELGAQRSTVGLYVDDRLVASDTGLIRIASCRVPDTVTVAFMPDSVGMLEDILGMTNVAYRPLTDRSLVTADLDAYNVIIVGCGSFRNYPSFASVKDRIEDYLRQGGSVVLLGQPEDWPGGTIPVSFVPTVELVDKDEITNQIPDARILSKPYRISEKNLLSAFFRKREVTPAVIGPAEEVFTTPSGAALLSVTRLGDGQIIFCGFPLLQMIAKLNIEAIHLFANILNY